MKKIKPETKRRIFHIVNGMIFVSLIYFNIITPLFLIILLIVGGLGCLLSLKYNVPIINFLLKHFERPEDMKVFPGKGSFFYVLSVLLVLVLFDKDIAMASIIIMALGDSIAPLVGQYYGKIKHPLSDKKFLEGTLAGGIAAFLGALIFISPVEAVFASIAAMIAEGINLKFSGISVNDNISMPLTAGAVIWLLRLIF
ncbi:SEC59/DGK1/VTE5 family protein [Candidatus Woesearchaeota archaeon]|nr:SEC59/DGK1/VTE5 family protein [Candidatus Woesearchaeota archaeon]